MPLVRRSGRTIVAVKRNEQQVPEHLSKKHRKSDIGSCHRHQVDPNHVTHHRSGGRIGQLSKQQKNSQTRRLVMVRIIYSLALFITREVDRLLSLHRAPYLHLYRIFVFPTHTDRLKSRHPALSVPISVPVSKRSPFSFSTPLYKSPKLIHIPTGAGRRAALYFWWTSRCRGMVTAQLLIPYR